MKSIFIQTVCNGYIVTTRPQEMALLVRGMISQLPDDEQKRVLGLAEHLRNHINADGGKLAFALVGAELASE